MKLLFISFMLFSVSLCYGQFPFETGFETQTFEDWMNSDGSVTNLSIEQPGAPNYGTYYLRKNCDGTNTVNGEMALKNPTYFNADYSDGSGTIAFRVKNDNAFDLYIRSGFTDNSGTKIVQTTPVIVTSSPGNWQSVYFSVWQGYYTLIEGPNTINEVLSEPAEMWIIHNEEIAFNGEYENGNFEIDNFEGYFLGTEDFKKDAVSVYPVPTKDKVYIKTTSSKINRIEVYDLLGRKKNIQQANFNEVNVSTLSAGVYLLKIICDSGIQTKKIIKS
ncbi:T9SS type A sorting domain-containing protein [Aequorivita sp. CIP111184]|uniref:T9SS type A sorting domain-containing protein n=1 Tax=Aequorivita sp. CIP111184 TaxID=2211356 RepID=UPI000DBBB9F6|nr:T9SS type A sorting domain-containing protein [Aequorivita sp. CIP111184]SRX52377.1 hypothetical protein AEQU1_00241 [Aequorivita sp. CIP111184]